MNHCPPMTQQQKVDYLIRLHCKEDFQRGNYANGYLSDTHNHHVYETHWQQLVANFNHNESKYNYLAEQAI